MRGAVPIAWAAVLGACLLFAGCSPPPPEPPPLDGEAYAREKASLDRFFLSFRQEVQAGQTDSVLAGLSSETLGWLEGIRRAARSEPPEFLKNRPFHEILAILALRVERRLRPDFDLDNRSLLDKLVVTNSPVRKTLLREELGSSILRGNTGEVGLRRAEHVPVFFFVKERGAWKLNLARSLPLILQGAQDLARQRKPTPLEQAIYVLETFGGVKVEPEDLR